MTYPESAADLARTLTDLTLTRAGAHLAPSPSPGNDEIALHAALRARGEVLTLVRTITTDVAPVTDTNLVAHPEGLPQMIPGRHLDEVMRLGRVPTVAAFADAVRDHPGMPLRFPATSPASSSDPRTAAWVSAGEQALLAGAQYTRAGGATTTAQRWSAVRDAAALAQLLSHLDTDLTASLAAHPLTFPSAARALEDAVAAGPGLVVAAQRVRDHASRQPHTDYATTPGEPHQVVRVDSGASLAGGQRRMASLVREAVTLSPATIAHALTSQERLVTVAAAALRESDPSRARLAGATARSLRAMQGERAGLSAELATLTREDPAAALQTREITTYLRTLRASTGADRAGLARAVDAAPSVLDATAASISASTRAGTWWTATGAAPSAATAVRPLGDYPWQRAEPEVVSRLVMRLGLAASHALTHAAAPPHTRAPVAPSHPAAHEVLAAALARRPAAQPQRGPGLTR